MLHWAHSLTDQVLGLIHTTSFCCVTYTGYDWLPWADYFGMVKQSTSISTYTIKRMIENFTRLSANWVYSTVQSLCTWEMIAFYPPTSYFMGNECTQMIKTSQWQASSRHTRNGCEFKCHIWSEWISKWVAADPLPSLHYTGDSKCFLSTALLPTALLRLCSYNPGVSGPN